MMLRRLIPSRLVCVTKTLEAPHCLNSGRFLSTEEKKDKKKKSMMSDEDRAEKELEEGLLMYLEKFEQAKK